MKKPEKREKWKRGLEFLQLDNEYNEQWDKWEAYHNWDIKENYIRKDALPDLFRISDKILEVLESDDIEAIKNFKAMINNQKETNNE